MRQIFALYPPVTLIASALAAVGGLYLLIMSLRQHLHWLQLEDYSLPRLFAFASKRCRSILLHWGAIGLVVICVAQIMFHSRPGVAWLVEAIGLALWGIGAALEASRLRRTMKKAKKKLVMTPRAKRIFILAVMNGVIGVKVISILLPVEWFGMNLAGSFYLGSVFSSLWLTIAIGMLWPQERAAQRRYMADAKRILAEVRPLIIGVTGSYGKTGTKELLAAMLADRYNVFRPPGSYNTLMGVTRAIREGMRPYHEAFVVEMGAYREGSIRKLCDLVKPQHGIITIIGIQHLERFGSQKVIQRAKSELVKALPPDGVAILNGDDPLCREIGAERNGEVIYFTYQKSEIRSQKSISATNIRITPNGSDFDLTFADGEILPVHLSLLGRSAIANAVAAAAMAARLGVSKEGIARALASMPHVRHRLEPKTGEGGITVIDDAFNSNPIGAAGALEVLGLATGGRRILVTPGMIELGTLEEESNRTFGRQAAKACDLAVLVGVKRIEPIRQGLLAEGFPADNIWVVRSLTEGLTKLHTYLRPGDTMLLENDLPDQYEGA